MSNQYNFKYKGMISTTTLMCNNGTIAAYVPTAENPWNEQKIQHLFRRAGFGANRAMINDALSKTPTQVVNSIISEAQNATPTPPPYWIDWLRNDFNSSTTQVYAALYAEINDFIGTIYSNEGSGLNNRLTVFWSNLLVASYKGYNGPPLFFKYFNLLERKGIGNFKELISDLGVTGAMLNYLNGFQSKKGKVNENYGRELLELFTLGEGNGYTQNDIVEISRALTGWNSRIDSFADITFNPNTFDDGEKTFFGRTGNWGYDDVINILFEERELKISRFICGKIYNYFVGPEINKTIVNQLASTFRNNDFEIASVLKRLFSSEHFFDSSASSTMIKSPLDLRAILIKEMGLQINPAYGLNLFSRLEMREQGQTLFNHEIVAGWDVDRAWINSSTLTLRWSSSENILTRARNFKRNQFKTILNEMLESVSNDVEFVTKKILSHFFLEGSVDQLTYQDALVVFKNNIPQNYFDDGSWNTNWDEASDQMYRLLIFMTRIPEFQLK